MFTQKKYKKGSMGQLYPYYTRWEKNIVVVICIYGARAIFLLLFDHQDTESEYSEIEMNISELIFTQG